MLVNSALMTPGFSRVSAGLSARIESSCSCWRISDLVGSPISSAAVMAARITANAGNVFTTAFRDCVNVRMDRSHVLNLTNVQ